MKAIFKYCILLTCIFCFLQGELAAQNLVLNPSFEENSFNCTDTTFDSTGSLSLWIGGYNYFFGCSFRGHISPPKTWNYGYQLPRTGNSYVWLELFSVFKSDFRKLVQGKLSRDLQRDEYYKVSFYVSLAEHEHSSPAAAINSIGAYITKDLFYGNWIEFMYQGFKPQIESPSYRFLDDTAGWMQISGVFKAKGGEKYIMISNFKPDSLTSFKPIDGDYGWQGDYFLDDVSVEVLELPNLGNDTDLCSGSTITLKPNGDKADSVFWQDGSRGDNFLVTKPGKYWVEAWYGGYNISDTINIKAKYKINLGADQNLCEGQDYTFTLPKDGAKYEWPDGSTKHTFTVNKSSKYWVKAQRDGCTAYDTAEIIFQKSLSTYTLPKDTTLCERRNLLIDLQDIDADVLWQDGSVSKEYLISRQGTYMLMLKNACGTLQHLFDVTEKFCDCNIYVPNAFTPDNNTINDKFLPVTDCIFSSYNLSIYNRWGVQVFSTDDITQGWDGKLKGKYCTQDVYYYTINAVADNGESFHIRKTFTLLRQ